MVNNFKVSSVLYNGRKNISFLPGSFTTETTSDVGCFCNNHQGARATLSSAVFFVKTLLLDELRLAWCKEKETVYGELDHTCQDGTVEKYEFEYQAAEEKISYLGNAPEDGSPYSIVPVVAYQVLTDAEQSMYALSLYKYVKDNDLANASISAYRLSDAFYFNYVKGNDLEITVEEGSLAPDTIKTAFNMGTLTDLSDKGAVHDLAKDLAETVPFKKCVENVSIPAKKKAAKKKNKNRWADVLKDIRTGKYLVAHEWTEEQLRHVPPMSYLDTFIPSEEFYEVLRKISYRLGNHMVMASDLGNTSPDDIKNDIVNVLLYGDPGSGKTALVHAIAAATGMPLYSIKFNEDSEDDVFEGRNKIVEGKISFVETEFLKGFADGGIVLMEEINLGRANMLTSVMNQALEYPFYVERNGYEKVTRHPLVAAFATMNLDTDGTMSLNSAMAQRFNNKYMIGEPDAKAFKERLTAMGFPENRVEYVYGVYDAIRSFLKESEQRAKYLKELSIRQCIAALNDMEEGTDAGRAVFNTMYGAICIKNRKLAEKIKDSILYTYPDFVDEE